MCSFILYYNVIKYVLNICQQDRFQIDFIFVYRFDDRKGKFDSKINFWSKSDHHYLLCLQTFDQNCYANLFPYFDPWVICT